MTPAQIASKLTKAQREFLSLVCDGKPLGYADREADKVRQKMRRIGLCYVRSGPRRWVPTPLGIAARNHIKETEHGIPQIH